MTGPPPVAQWGRYRTIALIILTAACLRVGLLFTPLSTPTAAEVPPALRFITAFLPGPTDTWMPIYALGYCWLALAALAAVTIRVRQWHSFVFILGTGASLYFMGAYIVGMFDPNSAARSWSTAWTYALQAAWLCFTGLITRHSHVTDTDRNAHA